jgi:hypothetical protein
MTKTALRHISATIAAGCLAAQGQIVSTSADLPSQVGDYYRAYAVAGTNTVDVTGVIGQPGGPQRWDFSAPPASNEEIWRMDVAPPTDGGQEAEFPDATYIERTTVEGTNKASRSYYRIVPNEGRRYYGSYDVYANPETPLTKLKVPTTDLPTPISYGKSWTRTEDWPAQIEYWFLICDTTVHFTSQAQADAYGTIVLPSLGELPALRVNELHTWVVTNQTLGWVTTHYIRNYYWLVRGVGKAVDILSEPDIEPPLADFTTARFILRVFAASKVTDASALRPVSGLRIRAQSGKAILGWTQETNRSGYQVEGLNLLGTTNWQVLAEPSASAWTNLMPANQGFFRVFSKP